MSLSSFNRDLLNERLQDYNASLERTLEQHRILTNQLQSLKTRFNRSVEQGRKSFSYKYSMQISCVTGTLCMYEEYMKRKARQIRQLRLYQLQVNRAEQQAMKPTQGNTTTNHTDKMASPAVASKKELSLTREPKTDKHSERTKSSETPYCSSRFTKVESNEAVARKRSYSNSAVDRDTGGDCSKSIKISHSEVDNKT